MKAIHPSYPNESLSSANTIPETTKLDNLVQVLQLLPLPNYETLEYLIRHLSRIASHADQTGMTVKNLAIVWAPNLLRSRELETQGGIGALQCIAIQAVLTEYLIRFVDRLFTPHSRPSRGLSKVAPSLCPNISPNRIELIHERVEITTTKTLRMRHEPSDDEQQRPLADTESGESQDEDVDESKKKATPIVGRKNGNDSNTYLRLITLKEARTRWERRRMIESQPNSTSDGRSNVDREVQIERIESIDRLCVQSESNEQPYESPLQMDESKIVLRHPNRCRKMNVIETPDSKPSSPIDRSFGVIGQFSSFRSKRNFGNLDLITNDCDDANEDEKVLKSIDSHVASSQLSSKSKFDFKDGSSNELRKCATFQPTINRYHTILNPKHFRKNKVNPNRFGQIQSQLNHYRSSED